MVVPHDNRRWIAGEQAPQGAPWNTRARSHVLAAVPSADRPRPRSLARRAARPLAIALLVAPFVWGFLVEPNRLVVHRETITLPAWPSALDGLRIAVLSDVHAGAPFVGDEKLRDVAAATNCEAPDVIVLLGDYVVGGEIGARPMAPEAIAARLGELHAPLGVFAVLGNHDWWFDGERIRAALVAAGIRVLENEAVEVRRGGASFWLAGLADLMTREPNAERALAAVPEGAAVIALDHNPDVFPGMPPGVALTLAGHTHGGQVDLPLLGRRVVPSRYGARYAAGHVEEGGRHLFVTTGIGTSILPVRLGVPPEVAVLTLATPGKPGPR
jgi:predicted MPP superfamily phosphohydrolase